MWWILGAVLLYLELFSVGIAILNKSLGERRWYLALIPVYGLRYVENAAGVFKVLVVPVKKCALFVAELLLVILLCCLYWQWGIYNVVSDGVKNLGQIMILPVTICYALMYITVLSASARIYKRFNVRLYVLWVLLSMLLLPIPCIFYAIKDRRAIPLSELFD